MKSLLLLLLSIPVLVTDSFTTSVPLQRRTSAFVTTPPLPPRTPFVVVVQAAKDSSGEEFLGFEPDDSELAKLGEELVDGDDDDDDAAAAAAKGKPKAPTPPLAFENPFDDEDDAVVEEEDDDEIDIAFDGDDEEEEEEEEDTTVKASTTEEDFSYDADEEEEDEEEDYYEPPKQEKDAWDEDDDEIDDFDYPLEDDEDPNYMVQKERIEKTMAKLEEEDLEMYERAQNWEQVAGAMEGDEENFEDYNFMANFNADAVANGEEEPTEIQWSDDVAEKVKSMMELGKDFVKVDPAEVEEMSNAFDESNPDDPYAAADKAIDEDLEKLQEQKETMGANLDEIDSLLNTKYDGTQKRSNFMDINHVAEIGMKSTEDFSHIPDNLMDEIRACMTEMGSASYNVTKWLVYDLDFNVTNLMLAACKHSPDAPILFEHWYPQLVCCERYQYARDGNFNFSWEDADDADMEELYKYYRGFGYNDIPKKAPGETGIIDMEEMDEDELQMADFAAWCHEVYNPEWDRKDFDDDTIRDVDNVFSPQFVMPKHPDVPTYEDAQADVRNWNGEIAMSNDGEVSPEQAEYRDMVGQELDYTFIDDKEFTDAFRGHLIVACTSQESDLDAAEQITIRFEEEFGKQVFVETRVISHAIPEDNVFEVWLESYETELLHSKKRATTGALGWTGKLEFDAEVLEHLVEKTAFLISDDSRYSYRLDMDAILT